MCIINGDDSTCRVRTRFDGFCTVYVVHPWYRTLESLFTSFRRRFRIRFDHFTILLRPITDDSSRTYRVSVAQFIWVMRCATVESCGTRRYDDDEKLITIIFIIILFCFVLFFLNLCFRVECVTPTAPPLYFIATPLQYGKCVFVCARTWHYIHLCVSPSLKNDEE